MGSEVVWECQGTEKSPGQMGRWAPRLWVVNYRTSQDTVRDCLGSELELSLHPWLPASSTPLVPEAMRQL